MLTIFRKPLVCVLFSLLLFSFTSSGYAADFVTVAGDNVNVRTGPTTDNPVHLQLFEGYPLKVLDKKGSWYKVSDFENDTGWIESSLTKTNDTVIVNSQSSVNLRSAPSTNSDIVATVDRGVVLTKVGVKGDWIEVRHSSGVSGWIYGKLVWP